MARTDPLERPVPNRVIIVFGLLAAEVLVIAALYWTRYAEQHRGKDSLLKASLRRARRGKRPTGLCISFSPPNQT